MAKVVPGDASSDNEIRKLKCELAQATEARDILKCMARPVGKG